MPTARLRPAAMLVGLYSATFGCVASALHSQRGFPLDDSYIYQAIARSVATPGAAPAYVNASRFGGATSPLWLVVQAGLHRCFPAGDPVLMNALLGWLLLLGVGLLLWEIAARDQLPEVQRWILAGTPALCGNLLWQCLIGMEHLLFLVLSLMTLLLWFSDRRGTAYLAGAAAGLLVMTRPEAGLLGLLCLALGWRRRSKVELAQFAAVWMLAAVVLALFNHRAFGTVLPSTLGGRTWLYFRTVSAHSAKAVFGFPGQWLRRLPQLVSVHFVATTVRLKGAGLPFTAVAILLAALTVVGAIAMFRRGGVRLRALLLWAAVHAATFMLLLPVPGQGGRYQSELLLLCFPALFTGLFVALRYLAGRLHWKQRRTDAALATCVVLIGASSLWSWRAVSVLSIAHIQRTHGAAARWLRTRLPEDARIASFDSGLIAYRLNRPIVDLGGLADPSLVPFLRRNDVLPYLDRLQTQYVVLPVIGDPRQDFKFLDLSHAQPLARFCSPEDVWPVSLSFTGNAWPCQQIYALRTP